MQVSVMPAEYGSWQEARADLVLEAKKPLKAQMRAEVAAAATDEEAQQIRTAFEQRERWSTDRPRPLDLHMKLGVSYNVRCSPFPPSPPSAAHCHTRLPLLTHLLLAADLAVPVQVGRHPHCTRSGGIRVIVTRVTRVTRVARCLV